jgi:hypothetical protein
VNHLSERWFLVFLALAVCALAATLVWATWRGVQSTGQICRAQNNALAVVSEILQGAQAAAPARVSADQQVAAENFYAKAFELIANARC